MKKQKTSNTKKLLIISLVALLAAGCSFVFLRHRSDARKRAQTTNVQPQETINYTPANDEEKQASEDNKKNLPDNSPSPTTPPPSGLRQVSVTITSVDANPVRARVDGVIEDTESGCTATFTKGTETFSVTGASVANTNNTMCAIRPDRPLSIGTWQITVSFKSSSAEGTSATQTINI